MSETALYYVSITREYVDRRMFREDTNQDYEVH